MLLKRFFAAGAIALAMLSGSSSAQKPITRAVPLIAARDFAELPVAIDPNLSPDGHKIVARRTIDGKSAVIVFDADNPQADPLVFSLGDQKIYSLSWAGSGRVLLTVLLTQKVPGGSIAALRLASIDIPSGTFRVLDPKSRGVYGGDVLYADPTGAWALVASQTDDYSYPSVKRVDLATGAATVVEKERDGVWDWFADQQGILRAGVSYKDRRWTVWYRERADEKLRAIKGKFDKDTDSAIDRFIFRGAESWVVTNERTGRFGLYRFDIPSGTIAEPIFEHPEVDSTDVLYDGATGKIKAIGYEDDRARFQWLDADFKKLQDNVDRALPRAVNQLIDWSRDERRVLIYSYSGSDPGRYFLLNRDTRQMSPVLDPYPMIDPALLSEVQPMSYQARDGLRIPAYLTLPRGSSGEKLPLIVMPHGGPFERDHWAYGDIAQFLANRGYAVFQPQFRGSTGYGKAFVEKGYGEWGQKMQDDLDDGVDWLAKAGKIDPGRVCIVGGSYGGYAALWGVIRNPERYRCAASLAGVSDLPAQLRHHRRLFSATRYFREWRTRVAGVKNLDLASVSPINFASRAKRPILIGHGEKDDRVPPAQSRTMVAALKESGAPVSSVFYKDTGHGFTKSADLEDWLKRLEAFLRQHNPT